MKTKRLLFFISIISFSCLFSQPAGIRFAVSEFLPLNSAAQQEGAGRIASEKIESSYSQFKWFDLRRSGAIDAYIRNLATAQAGIGGDEALAAAGGSEMKINYLTVGSVAKMGRFYEVDSRSVDINTWMIVHSSGCNSLSVDSACSYISKDAALTLTQGDLQEKIAKLDKNPTIAVSRIYEMNADAQAESFGGVTAEILNSELGALSDLAVMERLHLSSVINEKSYEMCGVVPNDDTSSGFAVRGLKYKLEGSINAYPGIVCIGCRLFDTSTGRLVYVSYSEIPSEDSLRGFARKVASEISDAVNKKIGTLKLDSNPSDALVSVDSQPYGKTPLVISLSAGSHRITVSSSGYYVADETINVAGSAVTEKKIELKLLSMQLLSEAMQLEKQKKWNMAVLKYDEFIADIGSAEEANLALYRKGHVQLVQLDDPSRALVTFNSLISRYPDSMLRAEAYFGIAKAYKKIGDTLKMKETVSVLMDKFPSESATEEAKTYFE